MPESTEQPQSNQSTDEHTRRQAEWEAEEVSVAQSLPSMFKPSVHHTSA